MKTLMAVAVAGILGCGGADPVDMTSQPPPRASPLAGNWILNVNASCALAANFDAATFVFSTICVLPDGTVGLETQTGSYSTQGDQLSMRSTKATCAGAAQLFVETFSATSTQMTWVDSAGILVFMRNNATGSAAATFGCFKMGVFTPSPLAPL